MYRVQRTDIFDKTARKLLSYEEQRQLSDYVERLKVNPWIGDAVGPVWFREVRITGKRIYFLIDEPLVLLVNVSDKKMQQQVIDEIRYDLPVWKAVLEELKGR